MRRREFLALAMAAAGWPMAARAQQQPLIGYLSARSPDDTGHLVEAFRNGLAERGLFESQNVTIEYRWALGEYSRLPALATELLRQPLAVLVSTGGEPAALAAKAATATTPIVFAIGGDPVKAGLVESFNRPGRNATGISLLTHTLEPKRLGLLRELAPTAATIGILLDESFPAYLIQLSDVEEAARSLGLRINVLRASTDREIDTAFDDVARQRITVLSVAASPFFDTRRDKLVALAAKHSVLTMYHFREFVLGGGLISYGVDAADIYRQVGDYAGRIVKGTTPALLPVLQPTKFELVINLGTAKALGIDIPSSLLARADEVIE